MGDEIKIVVTSDVEDATKGMDEVKASVQDLGTTATTTGTEYEQMLARGNPEQLIKGSQGAASAVTEIAIASTGAGVAAEGAAVGFGTLAVGIAATLLPMAAIALVSFGVSKIFERLEADAAASAAKVAELKKPFEELIAEITKLKALTPLADQARLVGVGEDAYRAFAEKNADAVLRLASLRQSLALKTNELSAAEKVLATNQQEALQAGETETEATRMAADVVARLKTQVQELSAAMTVQTDAQRLMAQGMQAVSDEAAELAANMNFERTQALEANNVIVARNKTIQGSQIELRKLGVDLGAVTNKTIDGLIAGEAEVTMWANRVTAAQKYKDALKQVADAESAMVRAAVEKALAPTEVTEKEGKRMELLKEQSKVERELANQDLGAGKRGQLQSKMQEMNKELAALGPYKDKWDEFRRRTEDIAYNMIDPKKYGDAFAQQLEEVRQRTGLSLTGLAEGFKDYSIFADPKNLVLIKWPELDAQIQSNINQLIGKNNVMKAAIDKAWAGMTKEQKKGLHDMAIDSSADLKSALSRTADAGVAGFVGQVGDKDTKKKLADAGTAIISTVTASMLDKPNAKVWKDTMGILVLATTDAFGEKGNLENLKKGGETILNGIAEGVKKSSALGDALLAACDDAIVDAVNSILEQYGLAGKKKKRGDRGADQ